VPKGKLAQKGDLEDKRLSQRGGGGKGSNLSSSGRKIRTCGLHSIIKIHRNKKLRGVGDASRFKRGGKKKGDLPEGEIEKSFITKRRKNRYQERQMESSF